MDFFGKSNKGAGMAAAFKEFDDMEDAIEEKKEDTRSFQEVLRERREKAEKDLQAAQSTLPTQESVEERKKRLQA